MVGKRQGWIAMTVIRSRTISAMAGNVVLHAVTTGKEGRSIGVATVNGKSGFFVGWLPVNGLHTFLKRIRFPKLPFPNDCPDNGSATNNRSNHDENSRGGLLHCGVLLCHVCGSGRSSSVNGTGDKNNAGC